jgi:hypothetical protein
LVLVGIAGLLAGINLYLLYLRPWRYRRRQGADEGYHFVSGLPIVGNLLVVGGCFAAFGSGLVGAGGCSWPWPTLTDWLGSPSAPGGMPRCGVIR